MEGEAQGAQQGDEETPHWEAKGVWGPLAESRMALAWETDNSTVVCMGGEEVEVGGPAGGAGPGGQVRPQARSTAHRREDQRGPTSCCAGP
jgi:hypothetical protein